MVRRRGGVEKTHKDDTIIMKPKGSESPINHIGMNYILTVVGPTSVSESWGTNVAIFIPFTFTKQCNVCIHPN